MKADHRRQFGRDPMSRIVRVTNLGPGHGVGVEEPRCQTLSAVNALDSSLTRSTGWHRIHALSDAFGDFSGRRRNRGHFPP
jgi:hypothetical protein